MQRAQPLLEIYSPELVSTQEELLLAKRYREATQGSRYGDVSQGGEDLFQATLRRLELWDVSKNDIDRLLATGEIRKTLTLHAPTQGVVTDLKVRDGMEVGPNDNLYTIADLSQVWLYADVYEYELPWVREGQKAVIELSYLPSRTFEGKVTYIYLAVDPKTRTARVRVELDNSDLLLKPDMFADVTIETETRPGVLVVPRCGGHPLRPAHLGGRRRGFGTLRATGGHPRAGQRRRLGGGAQRLGGGGRRGHLRPVPDQQRKQAAGGGAKDARAGAAAGRAASHGGLHYGQRPHAAGRT